MPVWFGISGRFVGNGLDRSVRFSRYIATSGWLQRAAYMPPLQTTRYFHVAVMLRAGLAPSLPGGDFYCHEIPGCFGISGRFVGDGLDRSVRFCRYVALPGKPHERLPPLGEAVTEGD